MGKKNSAKSGASVSSVSVAAPLTGDATADTSTAATVATAETSGTAAPSTGPAFDRAAVLAIVLAACEGKIGAIVDRFLAMAPGERVTRDALHAMIGASKTVTVPGKDGAPDTTSETTEKFDLVKATIGAVIANAPGMLVDLDKGRNAGLYLGFVPVVSEEAKKEKTESARAQAKDLVAKGKAFDSVAKEAAAAKAEADDLRAQIAALRALQGATGS